MATAAAPDRPAHLDSRVYWIGLWERAVENHDYVTAAECKQELERLGVRLLKRAARPRKGGAA